MLARVHRGSPPSATSRNTTGAAAGERWRTGVNETETETGTRGPAQPFLACTASPSRAGRPPGAWSLRTAGEADDLGDHYLSDAVRAGGGWQVVLAQADADLAGNRVQWGPSGAGAAIAEDGPGELGDGHDQPGCRHAAPNGHSGRS